jgi:hypothetical protein
VKIAATAALMGLLMSGCAGTADTGEDALVNIAASAGISYECPPGESTTTREGMCVASLILPGASGQEPYIVADPYRDGVIVVGVNSGHTAFAVDPLRPEPGIDPMSMDYFFTEDGGANWRNVANPFVTVEHDEVAEIAALGDPAMVFDEEGTLHISGMKAPSIPEGGFEIFYASTPDLGRSWSEPIVFTNDGDNDRNWIGYGGDGQVFVNWQNSGRTSEIRWSEDYGQTWNDETTQYSGCTQASIPSMVEGEPHFACRDRGSDDVEPFIRVVRLDRSVPALVNVSEIHTIDGDFPALSIGPNGEWHVGTGLDGTEILFATSHDNGATWSSPSDARAISPVDDTWEDGSVHLFWFTSDPWGNLHFIIGGQIAGDVNEDVPLNIPVAHIVIDAVTREVVTEKLITHRLFYNEPTRVPPAVGVPLIGDHFYGIDFTSTQGYMVYTREQAIDFTLLTPAFEAPA